MIRFLLIFLFPLTVYCQGELSVSLGIGVNFMNYSLSDNLGGEFTFESNPKFSPFASFDYRVLDKAFLRGRFAYIKYGMDAFDSVGTELMPVENSIIYLETSILFMYSPKSDGGLYFGGGPVASWVLGKENDGFDQIPESDLKNIYGLEVDMGYLFKQEKLNIGIEGYVNFSLTDAMNTESINRTVTLNSGRIAGLRLYLNFGLNK